MSYKKHHVKQKIRRIKPRKSIFSYLWFWIAILTCMVLAILAYIFLFGSYFEVDIIEVLGEDQVINKKIKEDALAEVNKNIFTTPWISLSSKNILFFDSNAFKRETVERFPNIKEVSIQKKFPNSIVVNLQQRIPLGIYCANENECFWIDDQGFLFAKFENTGEQNVIIKKDVFNTPENVAIGEQVVHKSIMASIGKIEKNLREKFKISLKEFIIHNDGNMDATVNEGWKIYFDVNDASELDFEIAKLSLLLDSDLNLEKRKNLEYIDLRFKDRAYYK